MLLSILALADRPASQLTVPLRSLTNAVNLIKTSLNASAEFTIDFFYSNKCCTIIDTLAFEMKVSSIARFSVFVFSLLFVCLQAFSNQNSTDFSTANIPFISALVELLNYCLHDLAKHSKETRSLDGGLEGYRNRVAMLSRYRNKSNIAENVSNVASLLVTW